MNRPILTVALLTALVLPAAAPSSATGAVRPLPALAPREGAFADEMAEIAALLKFHYESARLDARNYGLPENDFDDVTMMSLRQRREFRALYQGTPAIGIYQYPRWAFTLVRDHDAERTRATAAAPPQFWPFTPLSPPGIFGMTVGANINVSNAPADIQSETYMAIDPNNSRYVVGSSNFITGAPQKMFYSGDYGATWASGLLPLACARHSDPTNAFDSLGNAYSATLEYGTGCGNTTKVNVYKSTDHGATWSAAATVSNTKGNDKELMAVDYQPASPCKDRLYVAWDDGNAEKAAVAAVYTGPWTVSGSLDTASIGTDIAVGPNGEVYDVWANTSLKQINFSKSTNCGGAWSVKKTIAATADGYDYGIPSMCVRRALIYPSVDVDRTPGPFRGRVYVAWNDFTAAQGAGCIAATDPNTANIYFSSSSDGGTTWTPKKIVHQDLPMTDQFNQWMRVDDADGCIHLSWNDSRNDPNRVMTDIYYTQSCDGGATFATEVKVTSAMTDESGGNGNQYGDYAGLAVKDGVIFPFWTDRRTAWGTNEQVATAKICSDPKSVGAVTAVDANACLASGVTISWPAPTVFWGDGGAGARKYQLYKDGVLAQDNIAQATTSLTYLPGDALSHSYVIRAVNSCGNTVAYTAASAADVVDVTPPVNLGNTLRSGKSGTNLTLTWTASGVPDLNHYNLYGNPAPATYPAGWSLIGPSAAPSTTVLLTNPSGYFLVSAVDNCGNESPVE